MTFNRQAHHFMEEGLAELNRSLFSDLSPQDIPEKQITLLSSSMIACRYGLGLSALRLTGLADNQISQAPQLDWRRESFSFGLTFTSVSLQAEACTTSHEIRIFGWKNKGHRKRPLDLDLQGLEVNCQVDYSIDFSTKSFSFSPVISVDFSSIRCIKPASPVLRAVLAMGQKRLKQFISEKVSAQVHTIVAEKIALVVEKETETLDRFALAHSQRTRERKKNKELSTGSQAAETPRALQGFGGVGQFPLPKVWQVPQVDIAACTPSTIEQMCARCRTGDLLLFSGMAPSSLRIKRMTQSPFSHAVLIVREPELLAGRALCWQATASYHDGVLRDMKSEAGVQLNYLEDVAIDYWDECADAVFVHRLLMQNGQRATIPEAARQKLLAYIRKMDGKPYTNDMEGLYIQGIFEVQDVGEANYFCSGAVAEALMLLGVISTEFMQHQYAPRDFCNLQKNLPLLDGYHYAEEEFFFENPNR